MYREFGGGEMNLPSMKDHFEREPYEGKDRIINYLRHNGKSGYAKPGRITDKITGEVISFEEKGYSDGEYSWLESLVYYVEKYNLRLLREFEEKVLNN